MIRGTVATRLPVTMRFNTRASKGISQEGTLSFAASRDIEDPLKIIKYVGHRFLYISGR